MEDVPYLGELFALLSPLAWSFAVILFRKTGERVPALALSVFKNSLAIVLYLATFFALGAQSPSESTLRDHLLLLSSGAIGIAVADTLFFLCLNRVGASRQAIINTAYSPPIILLSVLFLGERLTVWQVLGVLLILGAVFSVGSTRDAKTGERPPALFSGVLFGLGACLTQAISIVMIKPFMADWPVLWMTVWRMAGGLGATLLLLPLLPPAQRSLRSLREPKVWRYMVPAVLVGTYISLLFWMGGFKYADASVASALNQTSTLFTFLLAVFLLKEPVTRAGLAGLALGLTGVGLVTFLGHG
jgi:drug/metabolite transporter (DMT)-like permease